MCANRRNTMEKKLSAGFSRRTGSVRRLCAAGLSLLFAMVLSGTAFGQNLAVTGTVTSTGGAPLQGVTIRVQGTDTRAITDATGRYRLSAPGDAVLVFSYVGTRSHRRAAAVDAGIQCSGADAPFLHGGKPPGRRARHENAPQQPGCFGCVPDSNQRSRRSQTKAIE